MTKHLKKTNYLSLIGLVIILILGPLVYFRFIKPNPATAGWFDDGWHYRTAINITNSGGADTNKKVKFDIDTATLYTAGKIKITCDDSRFTDINGNPLPYFLDSANGACNTNSTDYYVLVPVINADTTTIYHYYGNPSASKGSENTQFSQDTFSQSATAIATEEIGKAPIAYWSFNEGTGQTVNDSSSNRNNGTLGAGSSAPTWQTEDMCVSGKCLKFDGNDYVNNSTNNSLNFGTGNFSIGGWFKAKPGNTTRAIASKNPDGITWWRIQLQTDGMLNFQFDDNIVKYSWTSTSRFDDNNWHYFSITRGDTYEIYIDGKSQNANGTINSGTLNNNGNLVIGGDTRDSFFFDGFLDEVKIYPYARSAREIRADYNSRSSQKGSSVEIGSGNPRESLSQGLIAWWKFEDGSGVSVTDSSGNGNTGTLGTGNSAPSWSTGMYGIGGSFDGNDYVTTSSFQSQSSQKTICIWVKPQTSSGLKGLVIQEKGFFLRLNSMYLESRVYDSSGLTSNTYNSNSALVSDQWSFVCEVIDASTSGPITLAYYINGVQDKFVETNKNGPNAGALETNLLTIGNDNDAAGRFFPGLIDEIRVYTRALTPSEIEGLYNWAPGPVAYYNFNEGVGSSAFDTSGNGNNGGWSGTGTHWDTGKFGKAGKFNGSDDSVLLASEPFISSDANYTIGLWAKFSSIPTLNHVRFVSWGHSGGRYFFGYSYSADEINVGQGTITITPGVSYKPTAGVWEYWTITNNGLTTKFYKNGILANTVAHASTGAIFAGDPVRIGQQYTPNNEFFPGLIDDVRIYNYARTQKQIVSDMNASHPAVGSPVGSALAWYKFDEGYGTTTNNSGNGGSSLNGAMGTGNSAPTWTNNGKFGKALSFDGTSDYITKDSLTGMSTDNFTVCSWMDSTEYPVGTSNVAVSIGDGTAGRTFWAGTFGNSEQYAVSMGSAATDLSLNINANTGWHHICGVKESTGLKGYLDGKYSGVDTDATQTLSSIKLTIGNYGTGSYFFEGKIDEVKIYNYALTPAEVALDFNSGSALIMGSLSSGVGNTAASNAASQEYCIPGDSTSCSPPIARWDFSEGVGSSAFDTSGNGNNGALGAGTAAPVWTTGKIGKGLKFDGVNDSVNMGDPSDGDLDVGIDDFSIEAWFNTNSLSTNQFITIKGETDGSCTTNGYQGYSLRVTNAAKLNLKINTGSAQNCYGLTGTTNITSGWHHAAVAVDRDGNATLYLDGKYDNSSSVSSYSNTLNNSQAFKIGTYPTNDTYFPFSGTIDQVRIYNYARTPAQIAWDYNRGAPIAHWDFDDCQGATIHNRQITNSNLDGTLTVGPSGSQTSQGTCSLGIGSSSAWGNGATGKYNSSLNFDGTDDYVLLPDNLFSQVQPFSVSLWVNKKDTSTNRFIELRDDINFSLQAANTSLRIFSGTDWYPVGTIALNEWQNVVITFDGSLYKAYINGKMSGSHAEVPGGGAYYNIIGIGYNLTSDPTNGQIDDVKIFNYALTPDQVKTEYNQGSAVRFGD